MSLGKPIIVQAIGISDLDGTNTTVYRFNETETAVITVTPETVTVDDGQTLPNQFRMEFTAKSYNANMLTDPRVYTNASATPQYCNLNLFGAPSAQNMNVLNVIVHGFQDFSGTRTSVTIGATKWAVGYNELVQTT
jgi:hypothetical protein